MSSTRMIQELDDRLRWFVRNPDIHLLDVVVATDIRGSILELVLGQELHADNRAPFYGLEDACTRADDGFAARVERFARLHAVRAAKVREDTGATLPALALPPVGLPPAARFSGLLVRALSAHLPWNDGLVVVLAPTIVDDPATWAAAVDGLVRTHSSRRIRFVTLHVESSPLRGIVERLGGAACATNCALDHRALARELDLRLALMAGAPASAPGPARAGCAWPRAVQPPHRRNAPSPPEPDARMAAASALPAHVLRGAKAMRDGDVKAAVESQVAARDAALHAEQPRIAAIMELVLGAYLVSAGDRATARRVYAQAIARAGRIGTPDLAAQGWLALGAIELGDGDRTAATNAYVEAGGAAERGGALMLAIEAWRMAGRVRADDGDDAQATRMWQQALAVADRMEP
ncbi:hypothetical protein BE04_39515, partial [Sorangium cellulosum]